MTIDFVDLQELGADTLIFGEIDDPVMRHINPCIAWEGKKLKIAIRSCNFKVERKGPWSFRDGNIYSKTDVLYGDIDPDTLEVTNLVKLKFSKNTPTRTKVAGLEDVRLFHRKDGMHAIGYESDRVTRSLHNASSAMAEYLIKGDELVYIRTLKKPVPEAVEKNWSPTDKPSSKFEFTYSDSQVWKDNKLIGMPSQTEIHGGSQLLKQSDGTYLSLVHEKKLDSSVPRQIPADRYTRTKRGANVYDKYIYYTYLAQHDEDGIITKLSRPFRFGTLENIEFASGMVEHKGDFLISFGIRDCKIAIARISKDKLMGLFQ